MKTTASQKRLLLKTRTIRSLERGELDGVVGGPIGSVPVQTNAINTYRCQ